MNFNWTLGIIMLKSKSILFSAVLLTSCDRSGDDLVPQANGEFKSVIEIGNLAPMPIDNLETLRNAVTTNDVKSARAWCEAEENKIDGDPQCYYGVLGQSEVDVKGGATFTFRGTGGQVCLLVDPEAVFWNTSVATQGANLPYRYPDVEEDDGDIDIFAGLSSYYTGSPGIELGNFKGYYTDSLGTQIIIEYGECFQFGAQQGMNNAHAGRAMPEYCTLNTTGLEGKEYTVVLETFSIPLDDGSLSFAAVVVDGSCSELEINECSLMGESLTASGDKNGDVEESSTRSCTTQLEAASCNSTLREFCCIYPDMCGEDPLDDACDELLFSVTGEPEDAVELTEDVICTEGHPLNYLCCR